MASSSNPSRSRKRARLIQGAIGGDPPPPRVHESPPHRPDDKDGHLVFERGENLTPRYKIIRKIGEGTFGRVLDCWDRVNKEYVAIKVIRNIPKYRHAAMTEIDVLCTLAKHDTAGSRCCLRMKEWFDYRHHVCMVLEKLGPSLYDFLRRNSHRPFPIDLIREFALQILKAVAYMHRLSLTHTDLKPENILVVSPDYVRVPYKHSLNLTKHYNRIPKSSAIKLIDFGSATFEDRRHSSVVSTRHYRAPEVILVCYVHLSGLGWSYPCDMWSVGCVLVELCTGGVLFQTHENLEHLAMMEQVLGLIPSHIIQKACRTAGRYFNSAKGLRWPEGAVSRKSIQAVRRLPRLPDLIVDYVDQDKEEFIDLLRQMFHYDPDQRMTAKEALLHPFLKR
ncbi:serine/threonine-protein kinase AFC1 isoform X1 [Amborella trichopoda]|uniref:serine/threonine-protein kinase AFC1 isoform X1 n=1 Tax=Amborella trichopoda TaxID=13333 RepID=UPI0009BFC898|nr:serine/threonine-protein kinase AFC1 isoform X1 [Amborella trichopoda]|eukprot:XP_020528374.1 serine/threonine-protein kinase AFC1 isoform X1 [Amborella trichopoda]